MSAKTPYSCQTKQLLKKYLLRHAVRVCMMGGIRPVVRRMQVRQAQVLRARRSSWTKKWPALSLPGLLGVPSLPGVPGVPSLPGLPGLPSLPGVRLPRFLLPAKQLVHNYFFSFFVTFFRYPIHICFALLLSVGILATTNAIYETLFLDLPSVEQLVLQQPPVSSKILDRTGKPLFAIYETENRSIKPLDEIAPTLIFATIAIEDRDFYRHHGFSVRGMSRALIHNLSGDGSSLQGGSTLTQQLVKNRLLSSERTLNRKLRELLLAILTEIHYDKTEILTMYLNQVAYGGTAYGAEAAAQQYFGVAAADLSLAQAALLAGLPAAPSVYSPFGSFPELAKNRQLEVLRRMTEDGYITSEQAAQAARAPLNFKNDALSIRAPHFVMHVRKLLAAEYGEERLANGGLIVHTTLDLDLHDQVQTIVTDTIAELKHLRVGNGAALVSNPVTGEVLAMVGSANYFDFENEGQVNVTLRPRQPGSSINPLTYALALENGYTLNDILDDSPMTYYTVGSPPYSPRNYDNRFRGRVSLREALASSYNIPAVKLLAALGVERLIDYGERFGITTWQDRARFGLSLTLGGGEIYMSELTQVYGAFANGGVAVSHNPILKITDYTGAVLYENTCALYGTDCVQQQATTPEVAYLITNALSDNIARAPAFGPVSQLYIPDHEVAVKTGTTNSLRDNWTFGYTSQRVVGTWVGNNDNQPMSYVASGVTGASPIWNQIMQLLLDAEDPHLFEKPPGISELSLCISTNQPACNWCNQTKTEFFAHGTEPASPCLF